MDDLKDALRRARGGIAPPEPAFDRLVDRRRRKQRNGRIASVAMAVVALGVGIAAAALAFGHSGSGRHAPADDAEKAGPNLVAGPGQYYYWKIQRVLPGPDLLEQMWWGEDGSGRYLVDQSNPNYGTLSGHAWSPDEFPGVVPFETDLSGLSTSPDDLRGQLIDRSGPGGASPRPQVTIAPGVSLDTSELWSAATQILQMGNATPKLRVALYEVLASLVEPEQGVGVEDPAGRPAVVLTLQVGEYSGGGYQKLFFDPDTHLFMAMTGGQDGTLIVLDDGIVDSRPKAPSPDGRFFPPAGHDDSP